ncbi:hypothetical protein V6N11_049906 [Hibiscus sabdariffa]|uniref:Secreted protein n=1 Tax=Hibiscus sabdariffa TaxID=183260 RepID=A0ABR2T899_9ROSI
MLVLLGKDCHTVLFFVTCRSLEQGSLRSDGGDNSCSLRRHSRNQYRQTGSDVQADICIEPGGLLDAHIYFTCSLATNFHEDCLGVVGS